MQVVGINPPPVGKRYTILFVVGLIGFATGVVIILLEALYRIMMTVISGLSQSESQETVFSYGCLAGCLFMLVSLVPIAIGLNRNKKPVEIVHVQE